MIEARRKRRSPIARWHPRRAAAFLLFVLAVAIHPGLAGSLGLEHLRCEYLKDPLGIDTPQPRLSWFLTSAGPEDRDQRQTAYQILVSRTLNGLAGNTGDLWDSGKVDLDQSIQVRYTGKPLSSGQQCFWKVRVWDKQGNPSSWSESASWSMGLLAPSDWHAKWIGLDSGEVPMTTNALAEAQWIWFPSGTSGAVVPPGTNYFRRVFNLPANASVKDAALLLAVDDRCDVFVNGQNAGSAKDNHRVKDLDVSRFVRAGDNVLAISAVNSGNEPNPAGIIALLRVAFLEGEPRTVVTDSEWKTSNKETTGWTQVGFDEAGWLSARKLGPAGVEPWGALTGPEDRRLPARMLRHEFQLETNVQRATAFVSGLGLFEFYLNGQKIGNQILSPALTDYSKRALYVTFDVTQQLKQGSNCIGILLGNGRFYAPRTLWPMPLTNYGFPKLLLQMRVESGDGTSREIVSDQTWRITTNGPVGANNEYDGEEYDARKEQDGWTRPGFDDTSWSKVQLVQPPQSRTGSDQIVGMSAQMCEPIRVTQTIKPVAMNEPKPGVYIFDLGQNIVGWCRLKVEGPRGTAVLLRHAETLRDDGTLYLDNLRSARATDCYTLRGTGTEIYEPRFTYHGFRYVELTGYPGKPEVSTIEGRVVHDDLEGAGDFSCSNPLLTKLYQNIRWGVRGNYRSVPTDCPQRDERQGWMGDRSVEARSESYLFNTAPFYSKWLTDIADAQKPNGSVPDVCPAFWPIYGDDVTWPSTLIVLPGDLYEQYGDAVVLERHYPTMRKWMDFMGDAVVTGIITRDKYGDWCVPPEEPSLIHSRDPLRKTDTVLLATAFYYHDLCLMERYATLLNKPDEASKFKELAAKVRAAFNQRFLDAAKGTYANGSQTSSVLALAFGLAPEDQRQRIFEGLVGKITAGGESHLATGVLGCKWLMSVLCDFDRQDLAYAVATQTKYPGWGYMVEKGATTIWELWNGDTADPAMNSGNHVMLIGDLLSWLYEDLAGIQPDPAQPGYKHILMRPQPAGNLQFVNASHLSPYGLIESDWQKRADKFHWNIRVPVNTTATVWIPASAPDSVTEGQKLVAGAQGVKFLRMEAHHAVLQLGSGSYSFDSD